MQAVKIQVVAVEHKQGVGKKSNQPYSMHVCQCVVFQGDRVMVGELVLPKDHAQVLPGEYDATFTVAVGQDKKVTGVLEKLTPHLAGVRTAPKVA